MPTTVRFHAPRAARLAARAATALTLLAALASPALADDPRTVDVAVTVGGRAGFPGQTSVICLVSSNTGQQITGDVTVVVNGAVCKMEAIATANASIVTTNLGYVSGTVTACATFGGEVDMGDSNMRSVQAAGCTRYYAPIRAPMQPVAGTLRTRTPNLGL